MSTRHPGPQQRGFNLIELMVTVAVVAILAAMALPSFNEAIVGNRVAGATNDFIAAVNYARTEAIRRNSPAGICATNNSTSCVTGASWSDGWIVWATNVADPTIQDVLRVGAFSNRDTFSAPSGAKAVQFNLRGALTGTPATFSLTPDACKTGKPWVRRFAFSLTGNVSTTKVNCT